MSYTLIIGNKNYSSWSMRAWLLLEFLEIQFDEIAIDLYTDSARSKVLESGCETGMVPVLKEGDFAIWDTMAIIEYLYESYPQVWPQAKQQRARARSICAEMHAGFQHVRNSMPMNVRKRCALPAMTDALKKDIQRIVEIWENCQNASGGPWLFGEFSAADTFFAPVATRFQTYGVELSGKAKSYNEQILRHPLVVKWIALGKAETMVLKQYEN